MMNDQHELERLNEAWNEAYRRVDMNALVAILADDWVGILGSGEAITKTQLLEHVPNNPPTTFEFSGFELHQFADTAVTRGVVRVIAGEFNVLQRFMRVWAKRDGHWQAVAVQVALISETTPD
jgi:ketosteroid isomerase-like protein